MLVDPRSNVSDPSALIVFVSMVPCPNEFETLIGCVRRCCCCCRLWMFSLYWLYFSSDCENGFACWFPVTIDLKLETMEEIFPKTPVGCGRPPCLGRGSAMDVANEDAGMLLSGLAAIDR